MTHCPLPLLPSLVSAASFWVPGLSAQRHCCQVNSSSSCCSFQLFSSIFSFLPIFSLSPSCLCISFFLLSIMSPDPILRLELNNHPQYTWLPPCFWLTLIYKKLCSQPCLFSQTCLFSVSSSKTKLSPFQVRQLLPSSKISPGRSRGQSFQFQGIQGQPESSGLLRSLFLNSLLQSCTLSCPQRL